MITNGLAKFSYDRLGWGPRRYVHRHADRHQWAPAVLDEVLDMLGLTEVAA